MKQIKYLFATLLALAALSCQKSFETFSSKVYIDSHLKTTTILLDGTLSEVVKTLQSAIPQPEAEPVSISYAVDPSLVSFYNMANYGEAIILPEENYTRTPLAHNNWPSTFRTKNRALRPP